MTKLLLSISLLSLFSILYAQNIPQEKAIENENLGKSAKNQNEVIYGKLIWQEDFNGDKWKSTVLGDSSGCLLNPDATIPDGWKFVDSAGNDFFWHWSDVGPRGRYTSGSASDLEASFTPNNLYVDWLPEETTTENGFMLMESDYFNTDSLGEMITQPIDMNSYFEYGPLDFSEYEGVIFNCKIFNRFCCGSSMRVELGISADYVPGKDIGRWKEYVLDYSNGWYTFEYDRDNYTNLKDSYKNQDSVYIRIWKKYASHFFAFIDDIKFYEAPQYELNLSAGWANYINSSDSSYFSRETYFTGGYTMLPQNALASFKQFSGVVESNGSSTADNTRLTVKVFKDDQLLDSLTSVKQNLEPYESDTLRIATNFTPTELGSYQVSMTVAADFVDEYPHNNGWSYEFETTEHTYSRVRHDRVDEFTPAGPRDYAAGGTDGDIIVQRYDIAEGVYAEFSGVNVYMFSTTREKELSAIEAGSYKMRARGFEYNEETNEIDSLHLISEYYTLTLDDLGTWVYLPFIYEGDLQQGSGEYYVGVEIRIDSQEELRFEVGSDESGVKQPYGACRWYSMEYESWYSAIRSNYAIDLMVYYRPPHPTVNLTFNYDMQYVTVVDGDVIKIKGDFVGDSVTLAYNTTTEIATGIVEVAEGATTVTYMAYLNSEAELETDRTAIIADEDVTLNHVYSVKDNIGDSELNLVNIYPNPFNSTLTLENLNNVTNIIVNNVLGQTMVTVNDIENTVIISTLELTNGVYLITIVDANNNRRTEKVIKY